MRTRIAACAALVCTLSLPLAGAAAAQQIQNPDLFGKSLAAAQEAVDQYHTWDDAATMRRIADIGYRVAAATGYTQAPISFFLVDLREPNAFALPGGHVFVTRGMMELNPDDDELAALLGHEISHVTLQHGIKMDRRATLLNVLSQAALVGVMIGASHERAPAGVPVYGPGPESSSYHGGERVQGAAAASLILSELLLRSYSREFEDQADEEGQRAATAAGFDPHGGERLFQLMNSRLPQSHEYGYWRTHPFFEERIAAAEARGRQLRAQPRRPDDAYREACQAALLGFEPKEGTKKEEQKRLLAEAALRAYPSGKTAEALRRQDLHRLRDVELARPELQRDFGKMLAAYDKQLAEVQSITPQSPFVGELERERADLSRQSEALYPQAQKLLQGGVYQTTFLETFLSNYPQAPERARVAFELGDAYARTNKMSDAITRYTACWKADPKTELAQRSLAGLRQLASVADDLSVLQQLSSDVPDPELQKVAGARLAQLATSYKNLATGAEYLRRFPQGQYADKVATRLDQLAEQLYGEVVLYQGVGDTMKALDRIQQFLTHAPLSHAADRLRERTVLTT